jgi:TMEM175 potassium channel family protein
MAGEGQPGGVVCLGTHELRRVTARLNETNRVEAFSDGVFAIAITLLILEIKVPHDVAPPATLARVLAQEWPSYLAFVTSFFTILIMWVNHHRLFTHIGRCDDRLLFFNGLLLLGVAIVPFPTALVAAYLGHPGEMTAATVYNGTLVAIAVAFNLLWRSASANGRLLHDDYDREAVRHITESYRYGPLWYVLALALEPVSVTASLLLNLSLAVYFALPSRTAAAMSPRRVNPREDRPG